MFALCVKEGELKMDELCENTPSLKDKIWPIGFTMWAQESRDVVCKLDNGDYVVDRRLRNFNKVNVNIECWKRGLNEVVSWSEIDHE